eukprot:2965207-Amphidinium_carterae.1
MGKSEKQSDSEVDEAVWAMCDEEVKRGWIEGPFTLAELQSRFPDGFVVSRRFGLKQREKVRLIDDMTESGVNSTFSSFNKVALGSVDEIVALGKLLTKA